MTARVLERIRRGPEEDELIARLSPQEREVLQLLAEGLTNREIAARLYLAEKTIKNYVTSVLSKMGDGQAHRGSHVRRNPPRQGETRPAQFVSAGQAPAPSAAA